MKLFFNIQKIWDCKFSIYKEKMSFQRENLWKYDSQFDNSLLLNQYSNTVLFQPMVDYEEVRPTFTEDDKDNCMSAFAGGKQCINSLRLLSTEETVISQVQPNHNTMYFTIYQKNERTGDKRFTVLPYHNPITMGAPMVLKLEDPKEVVIVKNKLLVAVQRKCVSLYSIQGEHLVVKDFDSIGIGNRLVLIDAQHLQYKGRDFLLFFGNQKDDLKPFFKCIVYQIVGNKLKYIKKAVIKAGEVYRPVIIFDNYQAIGFEQEMFCLIIGGFEDYEHQKYIFGAYQIHLHVLLEEWIQYTDKICKFIPFRFQHTITYGKAVKITKDLAQKQYWLLFCTEHQAIIEIKYTFGQYIAEQFQVQNFEIVTKRLNVKEIMKGEEKEDVYYSHHTLYMVKLPEDQENPDPQIPYRVYWIDKKMEEVKQRSLREFLAIFDRRLLQRRIQY